MDKTQALQNLLNGTATEEEIELLKQGLASGEISIGGNVNQSIIIIGSGNTVELPSAALDKLGGRSLLGDLDRDLTGDEIATGLNRLESELPLRAPILLTQLQEQTRRLRPSLKTKPKSLSDHARREHIEALAQVNSLCMETLDISFNALCLGEEPPEYDSRSPFRGLESFRPEDSEFFFGREALTKKLVDKIKSHPFLAALGASGSGKSSLVMAGLIPALGSEYIIFRPGTNPLEELEAVKENVLVVVDQFEELFTLTRDEATRKEFIAKLLETIKQNKVVITLRSDFLGEVAAYHNLNEEVQSHLENVPPMDMDELRRTMEGQADVVGLRFEADLSQQILDDVEGEPGAMPLLQHALWELWNRRHGRNLRASEYRAFGGVKQAITSTAEKVYGECTKAEQEQIRDIFLRLTRLDDSDEGRDTRRRAVLIDLIPSGADAVSISALLGKLANARLIVKTVNDDVTEIEVAHEALIRHWERLRIWLNEDRDNLRLRESVNESAKEWDRSGRHESLLNSRWVKLDEALLLTQDSRYRLTEVEQAYLKGCVGLRNKEQRERERRLRYTVFASIALAVIFLVLSGFGWVKSNEAERQAQIALARQLAAQAQSLFVTGNSKQMTAVLLAIQSMQIQSTGDAAQILGNNTLVAPVAHMTYESGVSSVAFSPDGQYVVSGGCDDTDEDNRCIEGSVRVWNADSGKEIARTTHSGYIYSVAFSPDGKYVVSGSADGSARVMEVGTNQEISHMSHENGVSTVTFSPDGNYVASGGCKEYKSGFCAVGIVHIWNAYTGQEIIYMLHEGGSVSSVTFSPNGRYIVSEGGYPDSTVRVWDVLSGKMISSMEHDDGGGGVTSIAFSPDGRYIVSAAMWADTIRVWEISSGQEVVRMEHDEVYSVAFSPDGKYVVSGSGDRTARVWDSQTGQEYARMLHDSSVHDVMFSPNGLFIATGSLDGTVRIWKLTTGKEVARLTHQSLVSSIAFNPDGTSIVSAGCEIRNDQGYCELGKATVWNVESELNFYGQSALEVARMVHKWFVRFVTFSPDGRYIISASNEKDVRVWNAYTWLEIARLPHDSSASSATFSLNGRYVITLGEDGLRVWDVSDWHEIYHIALGDSITSINFSPDGRYIALNGPDNIVRILNVADRKEIIRLLHEKHVTHLVFSPDGNYVATGSEDKIIRIWRVSDGKETIRISQEDSIYSVDFNSDGRYVVSRLCIQQDDLGNCEASMVRVWNIGNGKEITHLPINGFASFTKLSPNSDVAASFSNADKTMVLWNIKSGEELARIPIENIAQSVEFSSDGKFVVLVGCGKTEDVIISEKCSSGVVRVWDALNGQEVIRIDQASTVLSAVFSPDGHYIVTGDYDGLIQVRLYRPQDLINHTCTRVTRNLTRAEWQQYIGDALPYQAVCPNLPVEPEPTPTP